MTCTFNDPRKVEKLDSCTFVFDYAWYCLKAKIAGNITNKGGLPTVRVVNSYAADSDCVVVTLLKRVDWSCISEMRSEPTAYMVELAFPTEGKPIRATRASPDFCTSKPVPADPDFVVGSSS